MALDFAPSEFHKNVMFKVLCFVEKSKKTANGDSQVHHFTSFSP